MNEKIYTFFPTTIYVAENIIDENNNEDIIKESVNIFKNKKPTENNWNCNMYTTKGVFDLQSSKTFTDIIDTVTEHVNNFAKVFATSNNYYCNSCWINIAEKGTYQEYHAHENSVFSAIYYAKVPLKSGKIIFENPKEPDMCGITNIKEFNEYNFSTKNCLPKERSLIIFRSYLRHMVEMGMNEEPRISIAFNFANKY